ncbi:hypothetical protein QYE76_010916 [Lolium multiflorum]|uniref:CCHC-type domain-containing protein n=1 Tax=Lolium multiflorum TaxID=4521 RepID=A0AAD8X549_LOLMU|nr:hypothetical protein QYE76_010916 [Lolium multiflorum]
MELMVYLKAKLKVYDLKKGHPKDQAKAPVVEKSSEKKEKRRTCYRCREKGHISSFCTSGNSSNPILIDGAYSLCKDKVGNVFLSLLALKVVS